MKSAIYFKLILLLITFMVQSGFSNPSPAPIHNMYQIRQGVCLGAKLKIAENAYRRQTLGKFTYKNVNLPWGVKVFVNTHYEDCYDPADGSGKIICGYYHKRSEIPAVAPYTWEGSMFVHEGYGKDQALYSLFDIEVHLPDGSIVFDGPINGGNYDRRNVRLTSTFPMFTLPRDLQPQDWQSVNILPPNFRGIELEECQLNK